MQKQFGLQAGDIIVGMGGNSWDTISVTDAEDATDKIIEARAYGKTLSIQRAGQAMELPVKK